MELFYVLVVRSLGKVTLLCYLKSDFSVKSSLICEKVLCKNCITGKLGLGCVVGVKLVEVREAKSTVILVVVENESNLLTLEGGNIYLVGYEVANEYPTAACLWNNELCCALSDDRPV